MLFSSLHTTTTVHTSLSSLTAVCDRIIVIYEFITCASSVMILNERSWQHGKGVDGLFEKVSFQMVFEGVESGQKSDIKT